eukprot:TRINITY_DN8196_c0_g1_i2.p1 TRINITY_DN8196_c0_g1~~TRINITY_DN8196_c0_g1_i2.p1  ORF type:complete len:175 (-),score=35.49 TRINITY_DN8196_c0_g1_i2:26-550(-)
MDDIGKACLDCLANHQANGTPFMKPELYASVKGQLSRSSLSLIRYFPVGEVDATPDDQKNNSNADEYVEEADAEKDLVKDVAYTYPSKTHTDTGILTLIICADVPGLQVWDIQSNRWIEVEKVFNPHTDMFVIMGRKMQFFSAQESSIFKATTHRVALPLNTERTSLLYFVDVR